MSYHIWGTFPGRPCLHSARIWKYISIKKRRLMSRRFLTLSWRRPQSYRNQSTDFSANQWTGFYMIWTLFMKELKHEKLICFSDVVPYIKSKSTEFWVNIIIIIMTTEVYSESIQTSKMKLFTKIVSGFEPFKLFPQKSSISDV